jgi:hypothetical protein
MLISVGGFDARHRLERQRSAPFDRRHATLGTRMSALSAVQRALTRDSVEFVPSDQKDEGVRLALPDVDHN